MAIFAYTAKSNPRDVVKGTINADSVNSAAYRLRVQGLFPSRIESRSFVEGRLSLVEQIGLRKLGWGTLAQFTEQFAGLVDAGIPMERSLRLLENQVSNPFLKRSISQIIDSVRAGKSLALSLAEQPRIFSPRYINMVRVGEKTGLLGDMLKRLAKLLDEEQQLRSKLKAALVYPIFLSCVGLGTVVVLMVWVIPRFSSFFGSLGHQLPLPTRLVIEISSILARGWLFLFILIVVIFVFAVRLLRIETFRFKFDKLCLCMPVLGQFIIKSNLAQLTRTLGILLSQGINMLDALNTTGETLPNRFIGYEVRQACRSVAKGEKLYKCFSGSSVFPATVLGVMAIGQESGNLPDMLMRLSEQFERETERQKQKSQQSK